MAKAFKKQQPLPADTATIFAVIYDNIVRDGDQLHPLILKTKGKPSKQSEVQILLRRFRQHTDAILRFIADPNVPFSNNVAEQAVCTPRVT
jgi:transposase